MDDNSPETEVEGIDLSLLRREIARSFDLAELRTLCLDLGIVYEDIAGRTITEKTTELVLYFQRRGGLLTYLLEYLQRERPAVRWAKVLTGSTSKPEQFRRIYYEGFDSEHLSSEELVARFGKIWLIGERGFWTGQVGNGIHTLKNVKGPDAVITSTLRYYDSSDEIPEDLGNSRVSVKVKVGPPSDAHSGAGLLFRAQVDQPDYYAFMLNPGNNVTLAQTDAGGMRFLWSREITPLPSGEFVTLKVIGQGSAMDLYVNDQHYHTASNLQLSGGVPGIIALSIGNFAFDDFILYQRISRVQGTTS